MVNLKCYGSGIMRGFLASIMSPNSRVWCKVARFNYGMDAVGAPDDLPYVTPKPVLHALTERERREGAAQLACHREHFCGLRGPMSSSHHLGNPHWSQN